MIYCYLLGRPARFCRGPWKRWPPWPAGPAAGHMARRPHGVAACTPGSTSCTPPRASCGWWLSSGASGAAAAKWSWPVGAALEFTSDGV